MARFMARSRAHLAALGFVALVLAATAGVLLIRDDGAPAARADGRRIAITLDDFRIRPQNVRAAAGTLTFEVRNAGRLAHSFRVRRNNKLWIKMASLKPGERRTVTRRLRPGSYRMFDALFNYEVLGMYGTLTIT
jgi:hypothetical protein